mmetsp:Transcript_20215/g.43764  ORF Transcript_20215/g.43764 Transcript_20215/m.43764 type:complete len:346 (-) Transcript_20215:1213-2250(-)
MRPPSAREDHARDPLLAHGAHPAIHRAGGAPRLRNYHAATHPQRRLRRDGASARDGPAHFWPGGAQLAHHAPADAAEPRRHALGLQTRQVHARARLLGLAHGGLPPAARGREPGGDLPPCGGEPRHSVRARARARRRAAAAADDAHRHVRRRHRRVADALFQDGGARADVALDPGEEHLAHALAHPPHRPGRAVDGRRDARGASRPDRLLRAHLLPHGDDGRRRKARGLRILPARRRLRHLLQARRCRHRASARRHYFAGRAMQAGGVLPAGGGQLDATAAAFPSRHLGAVGRPLDTAQRPPVPRRARQHDAYIHAQLLRLQGRDHRRRGALRQREDGRVPLVPA